MCTGKVPSCLLHARMMIFRTTNFAMPAHTSSHVTRVDCDVTGLATSTRQLPLSFMRSYIFFFGTKRTRTIERTVFVESTLFIVEIEAAGLGLESSSTLPYMSSVSSVLCVWLTPRSAFIRVPVVPEKSRKVRNCLELA